MAYDATFATIDALLLRPDFPIRKSCVFLPLVVNVDVHETCPFMRTICEECTPRAGII